MVKYFRIAEMNRQLSKWAIEWCENADFLYERRGALKAQDHRERRF